MARTIERERQTTYLVERYVPGVDAASVAADHDRIRSAVDAMRREGVPVRYLGSLLVATDGVVFAVFNAASVDDVADANRRADARFDRVVPAVSFGDWLDSGPRSKGRSTCRC